MNGYSLEHAHVFLYIQVSISCSHWYPHLVRLPATVSDITQMVTKVKIKGGNSWMTKEHMDKLYSTQPGSLLAEKLAGVLGK